jgi:hypothetical protein
MVKNWLKAAQGSFAYMPTATEVADILDRFLTEEAKAVARDQKTFFAVLYDPLSLLDIENYGEVLVGLVTQYPSGVLSAGLLADAFYILDHRYQWAFSGATKQLERRRAAGYNGGVLHDIWAYSRSLWRAHTDGAFGGHLKKIKALFTKKPAAPKQAMMASWPDLPNLQALLDSPSQNRVRSSGAHEPVEASKQEHAPFLYNGLPIAHGACPGTPYIEDHGPSGRLLHTVG